MSHDTDLPADHPHAPKVEKPKEPEPEPEPYHDAAIHEAARKQFENKPK
jgi:hypothetical protein